MHYVHSDNKRIWISRMTVNLTIFGVDFPGPAGLCIQFYVKITGSIAPNLPASGLLFNQSVSATEVAMVCGVSGLLAGATGYKRINTSVNLSKRSAFSTEWSGVLDNYSYLRFDLTNETYTSSNNQSGFYHLFGVSLAKNQLWKWYQHPSWVYTFEFNLTLLGLSKHVHIQMVWSIVNG